MDLKNRKEVFCLRKVGLLLEIIYLLDLVSDSKPQKLFLVFCFCTRQIHYLPFFFRFVTLMMHSVHSSKSSVQTGVEVAYRLNKKEK